MDESKPAKDGGNSDVMKVIRERFQSCVDYDQDNRDAAELDFQFVNVPGKQWDEFQKNKRKNRPCYEFNMLRQHCRQVVNDQRQARPSIRVNAVEANDKEGAELRQGLIRNIESVSHADRAYDTAFKWVVEGGYGVWRVCTKYADDDGFNQDISIDEVMNPFSVWFDPASMMYDRRDAMFAFVETKMANEAYKAKYPDAAIVDFDGEQSLFADWYDKNEVRVCEYWEKVPYDKTILALSDGRTVDADEVAPFLDEMEAEGITVLKERVAKCYKVQMSLVSGREVLEGPTEWPGKYIPLVPVYGDLYFDNEDGRQKYHGLVRHSRDPQRLLNYNITTMQEVIGKQPKSPYLLTPKMLEGEGVKKMWDNSSAVDAPYLPYTPDADAPGGRPTREPPPDFPAAFSNAGTMAIDLLKGSTGIHDASLGARSNETSGKAIIARQREGDTANFNYQDNLSRSMRYCGEVIIDLLPKVFDTQRMVRVLGQDKSQKVVQLYQEVQDRQTGQTKVVNDLSQGKFDVSVSVGPSFSTQRAEFADLMMNLSSSNPQLFAIGADLFFEAMDMPSSDELAKRAKMMLPPQIQQAMNEGQEMPPEIQQAMAQVEQGMQALQEQQMALQQEAAALEKDKASSIADKAGINAQLAKLQAQEQVLNARYKEIQAEMRAKQAEGELAAAKQLVSSLQQENQAAEEDIYKIVEAANTPEIT